MEMVLGTTALDRRVLGCCLDIAQSNKIYVHDVGVERRDHCSGLDVGDTFTESIFNSVGHSICVDEWTSKRTGIWRRSGQVQDLRYASTHPAAFVAALGYLGLFASLEFVHGHTRMRLFYRAKCIFSGG